jgi:thioredoxin-like negative regulator of GroEL
MLSLDQTNFREFIRNPDKPAIVKFYADWCKDCRVIRKPAEELAEEYAAHFEFGELDTMVAPELREAYQVRGIPTFVAFRGGVEVARAPHPTSEHKEVRTRDELEAFLRVLLRDLPPGQPGAGAASPDATTR